VVVAVLVGLRQRQVEDQRLRLVVQELVGVFVDED